MAVERKSPPSTTRLREGRSPRRPRTCGEDLPQDHLRHLLGGQPGPPQHLPDDGGPQLVRRQGGQAAVEGAWANTEGESSAPAPGGHPAPGAARPRRGHPPPGPAPHRRRSWRRKRRRRGPRSWRRRRARSGCGEPERQPRPERERSRRRGRPSRVAGPAPRLPPGGAGRCREREEGARTGDSWPGPGESGEAGRRRGPPAPRVAVGVLCHLAPGGGEENSRNASACQARGCGALLGAVRRFPLPRPR